MYELKHAFIQSSNPFKPESYACAIKLQVEEKYLSNPNTMPM
jgi:hypothetical protein